MKKLGVFIANFISIDETKVSSINISFWFFAFAALYCLISFHDIPDNLMTIIITLSITHGVVSVSSSRRGFIESASKVIDVVKNGGSTSEVVKSVAESLTSNDNTSDTTDTTVK